MLFFRFGYRKLSLWPWSSHETSSHSDDARPGDELWVVQEDGDLCLSSSILWPIVTPKLFGGLAMMCIDLLNRYSFLHAWLSSKRAKPATRKEMAQFHTDDYVDFLSKVTPDNMEEFLKEQAKCTFYRVFASLSQWESLFAHGNSVDWLEKHAPILIFAPAWPQLHFSQFGRRLSRIWWLIWVLFNFRWRLHG